MHLFSKIMTVAILGVLAVGCGNGSKDGSASTELPLYQYKGTGSAALPTLYLQLSNPVSTDSSVVYEGRSLNNTDTLALKIEVLKNIKAGINAEGQALENEGFSKGALRFHSVGAQSDNLLKAMGELYQLPTQAHMTAAAVVPLVFSSNKKNTDLSSTETYRFKLFIDNAVAEPAELFAVVDLYKRSFELTAKDSTHFKGVLSAFEGQ